MIKKTIQYLYKEFDKELNKIRDKINGPNSNNLKLKTKTDLLEIMGSSGQTIDAASMNIIVTLLLKKLDIEN